MKTDLTSFSRTIRTLDADGMNPTLLAVILLAGLAGVWATWLVTARVPIYQLSQTARLEVERVHPVAATVSGRVVSTALVLGREVKQGEVLLEVEADRERLTADEERTRLTTLAGQIEALKRETSAEEQAISELRRANSAALVEATQNSNAAEVAARQAEQKFARLSELGAKGLVAIAERDDARNDALARRAEAAAARAAIDRMKSEQVAAERDRRARLAALSRERVSLEGASAERVSTVARSERETERRRIRASASGRLGEVTPIQIGAVIREGDTLASIIPEGHVRAVAEFAPPALGRLHPGQRARLRLDGFPWTQYGHVEAAVTRVATETRNQGVRVEFVVSRASDSAIPLQHGMPGSVDVEVDRISPLSLLLRSLGQAISEPKSQPAAPAPAQARNR